MIKITKRKHKNSTDSTSSQNLDPSGNEDLNSSNICSEIFSLLFFCSSCSIFLEKACICKNCKELSCKTCFERLVREPSLTFVERNFRPNSWCCVDYVNCLWVPDISAKLKSLEGRPTLEGPELFQELSPLFECKICFNLLRQSHLCPSCSVKICQRCFLRCLRRDRACPFCRTELQAENLIPCNLIDNMVTRLRELGQCPVETESESQESADEDDVPLPALFNLLEYSEYMRQNQPWHRLISTPNGFVAGPNFRPFDSVHAPSLPASPSPNQIFSRQNAELPTIRMSYNPVNVRNESVSTTTSTTRQSVAPPQARHQDQNSVSKRLKIVIGAMTLFMLLGACLTAYLYSPTSASNPSMEQNSYKFCLRIELQLRRARFYTDEMDDPQDKIDMVFECLQKKPMKYGSRCFMLIAHTDNNEGGISADILVNEISGVLAKCGGKLQSSPDAVQHRCSEYPGAMSSKSTCMVFQDSKIFLQNDVEPLPQFATLILIKMGLPEGYALTEGAAFYRLKNLCSSKECLDNVGKLHRILDGNVLSA